MDGKLMWRLLQTLFLAVSLPIVAIGGYFCGAGLGLLLGAALVFVSPPGSAQMLQAIVGAGPSAAAYTGPGDIVSGATAWYGLRAYSAAIAATGTQKAVNIRRASDNATTDIVILTTGALDVATAAAFTSVDATGTGAITGTTLTFTGGHVGDVVTGGTTAPGTVIVSGSSPTWTVNISQTVASATLTLTWGLFVTTEYDQGGGGRNGVQATAGNQPQLLLNPVSLFFNGGQFLVVSAATTVAQPWTVSAVSSRVAVARSAILCQSGTFDVGYSAGANLTELAAVTIASASATDNIIHSLQYIANNPSSSITVDGATTGGLTTGANSLTNSFGIGAANVGTIPLKGTINEVGIWGSSFSAPQISSITSNQRAYWGF